MDNLPKTLIGLIGAEAASHGVTGIDPARKAKGDYYRVCLLRLPYPQCGFSVPKVIHEVCHPTSHRCGPCVKWLKAMPVRYIPYHTISIQYIEAKSWAI